MKSFLQQYIAFAKKQDWPVTAQDKNIIKAIFSIHHHFTQHDLAQHQSLKKNNAHDLREMLDRLIQSGMIRFIYAYHGQRTYEHVYGHVHHDHLICLECGRVQEFQNQLIEKQQQSIAAQHHFHLVKHSMNLYGLCHQCQDQYPTDSPPFNQEVIDIGKHEEVPLSLTQEGCEVQVSRLDGGRQQQERLIKMGVRPGAVVKVISNHFEGQMVIRIKGSRLALGHHLTHHIMVKQ